MILRKQHLRPKSLLWLAVLLSFGVALVPSSGHADEYVVFAWGRQMRIMGHGFDPDSGRLSLILGPNQTVSVPLDSVNKILGPDGSVLLSLSLADEVTDPEEPEDSVPWLALDGWSKREVWDSWIEAPLWEYRWMDGEVAWALIPAPPSEAREIEIRALPISYAIRVLGQQSSPPRQFLRVTLDGEFLGSLALSADDWATYRLPLPDRAGGTRVLLRLEVAYRARPFEFSGGVSPDKRNLGAAVDFIRYAEGARTGRER